MKCVPYAQVPVQSLQWKRRIMCEIGLLSLVAEMPQRDPLWCCGVLFVKCEQILPNLMLL